MTRLRRLAGWRVRIVNVAAGGGDDAPAPAAGTVPSEVYTWTVMAEAVAQVAACFHDLTPPARDGNIRDDALVTTLALWVAAILAALPRDRALGILEAAGLRAATGQHGNPSLPGWLTRHLPLR